MGALIIVPNCASRQPTRSLGEHSFSMEGFSWHRGEVASARDTCSNRAIECIVNCLFLFPSTVDDCLCGASEVASGTSGDWLPIALINANVRAPLPVGTRRYCHYIFRCSANDILSSFLGPPR